jgi:pimeloyl-ACP methyl ester carboxylesterase
VKPKISTAGVLAAYFVIAACSGQQEASSGRVQVEGSELAYQVAGNPDGEAIVLIHGAMMADAYLLLLSEPALADYYLVTYHRRGYGDSSEYEGVTTLEQQTDDVIALMDHLGIDQAHLVGHSAGGPIALSVAVAATGRVRSLISLEGAPMREEGFDPPATPRTFRTPPSSVSEAQERTDRGMQNALGGVSDWKGLLAPLYPGVVEQVMQDAMMDWTQGRFFLGEQLPQGFYASVTAPVLWVIAEKNFPRAGMIQSGQLQTRVRDMEVRTVEGLDHAMQILYPRQLAELIADWVAEHPIQ